MTDRDPYRRGQGETRNQWLWPLALGGLALFGLLLYANSGGDERAATAPATTTGQAPAQPAPRTPTR